MTVSKITKAVALCNNEVAFIGWDIDGMIPGCLGFDIVRVYVDTGETRGLATWVPFKGQDNQGWKEQDTGVWPVQKTNWRDLTLRRRRDRAERRPENVHVKYRIRPVGRLAPGLEPVPVRQDKNYTGDAIPLGYLGDAVETNDITVTSDFGGVHAAFNKESWPANGFVTRSRTNKSRSMPTRLCAKSKTRRVPSDSISMAMCCPF
jgi:hypothetical protein